MLKSESMKIYRSMSQPPEDAIKTIIGGKLKGMSDINPQWRYEIMTETFGLVGIGWKYDIQKLWTENGANGEIMAFAQVAVFVKEEGEWSEPVIGIGGSKLVTSEKGQLVSNDEGYKMAVTDAFSTALKMLGVAADIYAGRWDGSKYTKVYDDPETEKPEIPEATEEEKKEFLSLIKLKDEDGNPIFSKEEKLRFSEMRKTKTAKEVIYFVKTMADRRLTPIPETVKDLEKGIETGKPEELDESVFEA